MRSSLSVGLLAGVLHVLGGGEDFGRNPAAAVDDLNDIDVLDRIVRRRVHAERPARRVEFERLLLWTFSKKL